MTTAQEYQQYCDALETANKLKDALEAYLKIDPKVNVLLPDEKELTEKFLNQVEEHASCLFFAAERTGEKAIKETKTTK